MFIYYHRYNIYNKVTQLHRSNSFNSQQISLLTILIKPLISQIILLSFYEI